MGSLSGAHPRTSSQLNNDHAERTVRDRKPALLYRARVLAALSVALAFPLSAMSEDELHNPFDGNAEAAKEGKEIFYLLNGNILV